MSKAPIYIVGAGSVGTHVALNIVEYADYEIAGFFDDDENKTGTDFYGLKVLGKVEEVLNLKDASVIIGIAFPQIKKAIIERLSANPSLHFPTLIHERAWISKQVVIGKGCIIYPGTTINFGSCIGDFAVLNANCSVGHHTTIGAYTSFAPGVKTGGHTTFHEGVDVGIGAATIQNVIVGAGSVVGGQSMVINTVPAGATVAGIPARVLQSHALSFATEER